MNIQTLKGNWDWGRALDLHTVSSTPILDSNGEISGWDTQRTELGEELYNLKYKEYEDINIKANRVIKIAKEAYKVIDRLIKKASEKKGSPFAIDCILPVPPSKNREFQPVDKLAEKISDISGILLESKALQKVKSTSQIKEIDDPNERQRLLSGVFNIEEKAFVNKTVLLFDDLYRSGSTLKVITNLIKNKGQAKYVLVLTVTKTRSKQ